jgi:hypothetical protein
MSVGCTVVLHPAASSIGKTAGKVEGGCPAVAGIEENFRNEETFPQFEETNRLETCRKSAYPVRHCVFVIRSHPAARAPFRTKGIDKKPFKIRLRFLYGSKT